MINNQEYSIECDECRYIFNVDLVKIQNVSMKIKDKDLIVSYFMCPECKKIYVCTIQDYDINKIRLDLRDCQVKIDKAINNKNYELAQTYSDVYNVKRNRLVYKETTLKVKYLEKVVKALEELIKGEKYGC